MGRGNLYRKWILTVQRKPISYDCMIFMIGIRSWKINLDERFINMEIYIVNVSWVGEIYIVSVSWVGAIYFKKIMWFCIRNKKDK